MNLKKSKQEYKRACNFIPGGVNSPVRAFKSVNSTPVFIQSAKASVIKDIDGNNYIDFVCSWGPLILGHAHDNILSSIINAAKKGTSYGAPTIYETKLAELITQMVPSVEKIRMVNSGTEATMSAVRLARGYTRREKIIKFAGCYHGHGDSFLIKAGSGAVTLGLPDSPGVTVATAKDTLIAEYNNIESVEKIFKKKENSIAAVIVEPVAGNMGVIPPASGFLESLRSITKKYGALLIFDEVITGFRLTKGGAQELYGVIPDITTLGKIIGGGLPVGAYGGKKEIMEKLAPLGPVYQAGTLSGNPIAMAAGIAQLKILNNSPEFYNELERKSAALEKGLLNNLKKTNTQGVINRVGSMMTLFFTDSDKLNSFNQVMRCDTEKYAKYFRLTLGKGIYIAPSQFECLFVSQAHTDNDIKRFIDVNYSALKNL